MSATYRLVRGIITRLYNLTLDTPPVLDHREYFPEANQFASQWQALQKEALAVAGDLNKVPKFHEIMSEQYELSAHGEKEWRMFILRAYGLDIEDNMAHCPTLAALVRACPSVKSASLSFLAPGKEIPTHTGPFRGITRFYMGLSVPEDRNGEPGVTLTIDDKPHKLGNGEFLLWDDTYPHGVENPTDQWRIALLMDVYRENMSGFQRWLTDTIIAAAAYSIKKRRIFPEEFI